MEIGIIIKRFALTSYKKMCLIRMIFYDGSLIEKFLKGHFIYSKHISRLKCIRKALKTSFSEKQLIKTIQTSIQSVLSADRLPISVERKDRISQLYSLYYVPEELHSIQKFHFPGKIELTVTPITRLINSDI